MRTALDTLLARPPALRALRALITPSDSATSQSHHSTCHCRRYHRSRSFRGAVAVLNVEEHDGNQEGVRSTVSDNRSSRRTSSAIKRYNDPRTEHTDSPPVVRRLRTGKRSAWDELNFQSDVAQSSSDAPRLVDGPEKKLDFDYWVELLEFRQRIYGGQGVHDIWHGIGAREIDIPTKGRNADVLWGTFLKHKDLFKEILDYATSLRQKTGRSYEPLYENIVGYFLDLGNAQSAFVWHRRLREQFYVPAGALQELALRAARNKLSLNAFRRIYIESEDRNVYDSLISTLCDQGQYDTAMEWHSFLVKNYDYPSKASASKPMMQHFAAYGNQLSPGRVSNVTQELLVGGTAYTNGPASPDGKPVEGNRFSREMMNRLLGKTHAVEPKVLDDSFCARLFATKTFGVDMVISGLGMLGVEEVGPLALRELAVRAPSPEVILQKLEQLKATGISIKQSVFSSAVVRFAAENRTQLLSSVLSTDEHPDVFEDQSLQKELLSSYVKARDWQNVHLTLGILTVFHSEPLQESWNLLLRSHSQHSDHATLIQVLEDMRMARVKITRQSWTTLYQYRLRPRRRGMRPATQGGDSDDLLLIANIWRSALESGRTLHPLRWREILRRFGMTGRFEELSRLTLWIASWYSTNKTGAFEISLAPQMKHGRPTFSPDLAICIPLSHRAHAFDLIFTPKLLDAIITHGFNAGIMSVQRQYERRHRIAEKQRRQQQHQYSALSRSIQWMPTQSSHPGIASGDLSPFLDDASPSSPNHNRSKPTTLIPLRRHSPTSIPHLSGLRLLQSLKARGVHVQTPTVRKALRQRLWILFGPGRSAVRFNRRARLLNPYSLEHFVAGAERLWGEALFGLSEELLGKLREGGKRKGAAVDEKGRVAVRAELLFRLFGARPVIKKMRNRRVDERVWGKVLERRVFSLSADRAKRRGFKRGKGEWARVSPVD